MINRKDKYRVMNINKYYDTRKVYALIDGKIVWADEEGCGGISTRDWLVGKRGMTEEQFEQTVRGAVYADHVVICRGSEYASVNLDELPGGTLRTVVGHAYTFYGSKYVEVHNGCIVGEPGIDWTPRINLGSFVC